MLPGSGTRDGGLVMTMIEILGWSLVAAGAAWGITLAWASAAFARSRQAADDELKYWQAEAARARELVAQLKQERAVWSRGCRQGREDVIAIMPLLIAAQQGLSGARASEVPEAADG